MLAYLGVAPGASPRPGDWAPAVLDVFFENRAALSPRRNLKRLAVKAMLAAVGATKEWNLLIGLGTPHVFARRDRNDRIRQPHIDMNDESDMIMAFEVCLETGPNIRVIRDQTGRAD
jgi:hypothetical protein